MRMLKVLGLLVGLAGAFIASGLMRDAMPDRVNALRSKASLWGNVEVHNAKVDATGLLKECCDAIYMRKVYHHFTDPEGMTSSLFESVRPGGIVALIDFEPRWWRFWCGLPTGVPKNRGGHGMPADLLVAEMTAAGFEMESKDLEWWSWPTKRFCVLFRRP